MQLVSSSFSDGAPIPQRYTCDGEDLSPPLAWSGAPSATRSFALLCEDPDAPAGTWCHWAVYDIPATCAALAEGDGRQVEALGFKPAINDFKRPGYGGPCPPRHHGLHHYHFRLLALSVDRLAVGGVPSCRNIARAVRKHLLAEATLVGVYER